MAKRVAIVQSSYIPWKGYFDLIASVDEFVLYDDAQYTKRDWRNRNRIKSANGLLWLTIPVAVKGRFEQRIRDTEISDSRWPEKHWRSIRASYARAPFFSLYQPALEELYGAAVDTHLSAVNFRFISRLCGLLGIATKCSWSSDFSLDGDRTERLAGICRQAGATEYLSGPSARAYIDDRVFERAGITVRFADYTVYPEYPQLYPPFEHRVSIIDLLVHTGQDARQYMRPTPR